MPNLIIGTMTAFVNININAELVFQIQSYMVQKQNCRQSQQSLTKSLNRLSKNRFSYYNNVVRSFNMLKMVFLVLLLIYPLMVCTCILKQVVFMLHGLCSGLICYDTKPQKRGILLDFHMI